MNVIRDRRSVRTYDGRPLTAEDRQKLMSFAESVENPYGVKIEFRLLEPGEYGLKSPVLSGETLYLAAKTKREKHFEEALGYALEAVVIYACSIGIGTVWIGGTMNRENFEKAMELSSDEIMPCVTPVGYPAKRMGVKESLMRKGVKADSRAALGELAFNEAMEPYSAEEGSPLSDALEMVRWAPSAVNKQPWRMVVGESCVHFYEKPDKGYVSEATGDLQRIDIGIAMYHFVYGMQKAGMEPRFSAADPGLSVPPEWQYVATYTF